MNSPDRQRLVFELFNEIGIIQQLSSTIMNQRLPDGLHVSHFGVINHLVRLGDGRIPARIADAFQVTRATMTHTLNVLSRRGFIEIRQNPEDGRSKLVYLTDAGRKFREVAISNLDPAIEKLSGKLDFDSMQNIIPELRHIREILDNNRDV